jgi:hypothetical protein
MSPQAKDVVKLEVTEKMMMGFREKYHKKNLPTADTKEGYIFLKAGVAELRTLRNRTEDHRKILVAPLNEKVRLINTTVKGFVEELAELEAPMKELKKVEDDRIKAEKEQKRIEEERRVASIMEKIRKVSDTPLALITAPPEEIQKAIDDLMTVDPEQDFGEYVSLAIDTVDRTMTTLRTMHQKAVDAELVAKAKADQKAIDDREREKREAEEEAKRKADADELAELRKLKAELKKDEPEPETIDGLTVKMHNDMNPDMEPEPLPPPAQKRVIEKIDEIQDDMVEVKEATIESLTVITEKCFRGNIGASGMAQMIFDAVYTGQVKNLKFDPSE